MINKLTKFTRLLLLFVLLAFNFTACELIESEDNKIVTIEPVELTIQEKLTTEWKGPTGSYQDGYTITKTNLTYYSALSSQTIGYKGDIVDFSESGKYFTIKITASNDSAFIVNQYTLIRWDLISDDTCKISGPYHSEGTWNTPSYTVIPECYLTAEEAKTKLTANTADNYYYFGTYTR